MQKIEIRTRRMTLHPMTDAEIENLIACTDSDELHTAYGEMLDGCRRDPENRIWYAPWAMVLHENQAYIGDIDFKGPAQNHAVEIGYGVLPQYEGNGYTTEALRALAKYSILLGENQGCLKEVSVYQQLQRAVLELHHALGNVQP